MKRILTALLAAALAGALAACGAETAQSGAGPSSLPTSSVGQAAVSGQEAVPAEGETAGAESTDGRRILIAYFSWSGNTETLAEMIQAEIGGDLFAIEPAEPYTDDYNALLDVARQEQRDNARPALASEVEDWDAYDTVFVGYPNWWSDAPMVVLSFLESYDCAGKTIIPFATSGGGGFGGGVDSITESAAGATVLDGLHVSGSRVDSAAEDVAAWIDGLGL